MIIFLKSLLSTFCCRRRQRNSLLFRTSTSGVNRSPVFVFDCALQQNIGATGKILVDSRWISFLWFTAPWGGNSDSSSRLAALSGTHPGDTTQWNGGFYGMPNTSVTHAFPLCRIPSFFSVWLPPSGNELFLTLSWHWEDNRPLQHRLLQKSRV